MSRLIALLTLLMFAGGCNEEQAQNASNAAANDGADARAALAWLDTSARVNSAVRLTGPAGVDVRDGAYWQPEVAGKTAELNALIRTRDYSVREGQRPDPQRVSVLDLRSGGTVRLDELYAGLPFELAVSPNHRFACVAAFPPNAEGQPMFGAVALRCYGYGGDAVEVAPQPAVLPVRVDGSGAVYCRVMEGVSTVAGLPSAASDWAAPLQVLNVPAKRFSSAEDWTVWPSPFGDGGAGYSIDYDPALPERGNMQFAIESGSRSTWTLPYYVSATGFEWLPPLAWAGERQLATVTFRPKALGTEAAATSSGLFRIVVLGPGEHIGLIEDHVDPGVSLLSVPGVLFYTRAARGETGETVWEIWATNADGLRKQRVWHSADSIYVELFDSAGPRRLLLHRQFLDGERQLRSQILELSLDKLEASQQSAELKPLESVAGVEEEGEPITAPETEPPPSDLGGEGGFIPDNPLPPIGGGPPPIADP